MRSETVQPLPFALMRDDYPMINGRGYPDTVDRRRAAGPGTRTAARCRSSRIALITASAGQKVLLRISNISITRVLHPAGAGSSR